MRILVAIDGSPPSDAAIAEVCRRPWPPGSEVRVLTVDSPWKEEVHAGGSPGVFDELNRKLRTEAIARLDRAVATFKREAPGLSVVSVLREGWPKDVILDEAGQFAADLIVVGSHGYGSVKRFFIGSVSLAVATAASCSVLIARSRSDAAPGPGD